MIPVVVLQQPAEWRPRTTSARRPALPDRRAASYGTPGFRVKDKLFARIREEDVLVVWCEDLGDKDALLQSDPAKFFTTPHYDGYPSVLVRLSAVDLDELTELLIDAWRVRAPEARRAFDAEHGVEPA